MVMLYVDHSFVWNKLGYACGYVLKLVELLYVFKCSMMHMNIVLSMLIELIDFCQNLQQQTHLLKISVI